MTVCEECAKIKPGEWSEPDSADEDVEEEKPPTAIEIMRALKPGESKGTVPMDEIRRRVRDFREKQSAELKTETSADLIAAYTLLKRELPVHPALVYYPSSATDASPSQAFADSRVVYVDLDKKSVSALKKAGFEAYEADATKYQTDQPVDVLILLNPGGTDVAPANLVRVNGYVFCNDYHRTATAMRNNPDFCLIGIVLKSQRAERDQVFDREDPDRYWQEIDNDEEFRRTPFSWGMQNYNGAIKILTEILGKEKILEIVKQGQVAATYREIFEQAKMNSQFGEEGLVNYKKDSLDFMLLPLPRQKGSTDDIFVFQRVKDTREESENNILK